MRKLIVSLLVLLTVTCLCGFEKAGITIAKDFSDRQIKRAERQIFKQFGDKVRIQVISRNEKKEITNLDFFRYRPDGSKGGGCASDKFGLLVVTKNGCRIADAGYESNITSMNK